MNIDVIIPALNEEQSVGQVVEAVLRQGVRFVFVADNGSTDATAQVAQGAGARVVAAPARGYGSACLAALAALPSDTDIVVFLDADGSDEPACLLDLVQPIVLGTHDLVVGSRVQGRIAPGAITPQQRVGNAIASRWLRARFGLPATDLGPFRAIGRRQLEMLGMRDKNYGWTVEMQIKAAKRGLRYGEVPVPTYKRVGRSKISGTVRGVLGATVKILGLLAYYDFVAPRRADMATAGQAM